MNMKGFLHPFEKLEGQLSEEQSLSGDLSLHVCNKDYEALINKPHINGNELIGDKTFAELGLFEITPQEIDDLFDELIYGGQ